MWRTIRGFDRIYLKKRLYFDIERTDICLVQSSNKTSLRSCPMKAMFRLFPWPIPSPRLAGDSAPSATRSWWSSASKTPSISADESAAIKELRSSTLRAMFPLLFSRFARRSDLWQAVVIERYLSDATSLADLEQRIEAVRIGGTSADVWSSSA
jgi:hypothetical protein